MTDVKVYAGNAGPFLHGCVRYDTTDVTTVLYHTSTSESTTVQLLHETNNVGLVVGLSVGLSVLVIFLVIVAVVFICKRRSRNKQIAADNYDNIEVEMSPASAEHHATDGEW